MFTPIHTQRLTLRPFRDEDLEAFLAYRNHPEVARYQSWEQIDEEEARRFIRSLAAARPGVPGHGYQFAVALGESDLLIGDLYMGLRVDDPKQAEIGFSFAPEHQGQGYATEAVSALLDYAFSQLELHRVVAVCDTRNTRSAALMERVGLRREGHFLKNVWFKGAYGDEYLYAVLRDEWLARARSFGDGR